MVPAGGAGPAHVRVALHREAAAPAQLQAVEPALDREARALDRQAEGVAHQLGHRGGDALAEHRLEARHHQVERPAFDGFEEPGRDVADQALLGVDVEVLGGEIEGDHGAVQLDAALGPGRGRELHLDGELAHAGAEVAHGLAEAGVGVVEGQRGGDVDVDDRVDHQRAVGGPDAHRVPADLHVDVRHVGRDDALPGAVVELAVDRGHRELLRHVLGGHGGELVDAGGGDPGSEVLRGRGAGGQQQDREEEASHVRGLRNNGASHVSGPKLGRFGLCWLPIWPPIWPHGTPPAVRRLVVLSQGSCGRGGGRDRLDARGFGPRAWPDTSPGRPGPRGRRRPPGRPRRPPRSRPSDGCSDPCSTG